jgi:hypothetical protein
MKNKNIADNITDTGLGYKATYIHEIPEEGIIVKGKYNGKEEIEYGKALAVLLLEDKVILNNHWWIEEWDEEFKKLFSINLNCSDVFAWGCADTESFVFSELEDVFNHYEKDNNWGTEVWCIKKRNMLPQQPVFDKIQKDGIWDLTQMNLEKNPSWE